MRFESLEHYDIDPRKLAFAGLLAGGAFAGACLVITGQAFGTGGLVFATICGGLACYVVVTVPKRIYDSERVSQARDAPFLSAVVNTTLGITGSLSRTYFVVRSDNPTIERTLVGVRRGIALGMKTSKTVAEEAEALASYSATNALVSAVRVESGILADSGEEAHGLSRSDDFTEETRYPFFLTVCFFSPLMMILFAVLANAYSPVVLAEIVGAELVLLDVTYYLCYGGREGL